MSCLSYRGEPLHVVFRWALYSPLSRRFSSSYQFSGVESSHSSSPVFRGVSPGSCGLGSDGQRDGGCLLQPSGGFSLPVLVSTRSRSLGVVSSSRDSPLCFPYFSRGEPAGGFPFSREIPSIRMDVECSGFRRICLYLSPPPEVDLFASLLNFQLPKYCSWVRVLQAWRVDAMSVQWSGLRLYAFPPFSMIPSVLEKIV